MGSNIVSIKDKTKLGCNICDKCCINRGDIKITPINALEISRYMQMSLHEFIDGYTTSVEGQPLERVVKAVGNQNRCILNDAITSRCMIHPVKPMQCVTFPLVPIDLEKDLFYKQDTCVCENQSEIPVIDWLNGKNGIYVKYKRIYMEWINFVDDMQKIWHRLDDGTREDIFNIVYYSYSSKDTNVEKCVKNNIKRAKKLICKIKP